MSLVLNINMTAGCQAHAAFTAPLSCIKISLVRNILIRCDWAPPTKLLTIITNGSRNSNVSSQLSR